MSGPMSEFLDGLEDKKVLNRDLDDFHHATGLDLVDMHNGVWDVAEGVPLCGLKTGRFCQIVGRAGSGKTTLAIQMALGLTRGVGTAHVIHYDVEHGTSVERLEGLTGERYHGGLDRRYTLVQRNTTIESLFTLMSELYEHKMSNPEHYAVAARDFAGREKEVQAPTVVVIDSLNMLAPAKSTEADAMDGNMAGGLRAKSFAAFIRQFTNRMLTANIHVLIVNHITSKIDTGRFPTPAETKFLPQDEHIPGGSMAMYATDYMLRLQPGAKLEESDKFRIKGFMVRATALKSRGNAAGRDFQLVLDQARGFDNELSNFLALRESGAILSGGAYFRFADDTKARKFRQSEFKEKLKTVPELADVYRKSMRELLRARLPEVGKAETFAEAAEPEAESASA